MYIYKSLFNFTDMLNTDGRIPVGKTATVTSLSGYIAAIKKNRLQYYISRGENRKHNDIICSLFRDKDNEGFDISKLHQSVYLDEYFDEVCNNLSDMQRKHFLAFSQHHGLPTCLLDFTTSPLISLYFACRSNNNKIAADESGYVYFIHKKRLIDIGSLIAGNANVKYLNELLAFDDNSVRLLELLLADFSDMFYHYATDDSLSNILPGLSGELLLSKRHEDCAVKYYDDICSTDYNCEEKISNFINEYYALSLSIIYESDIIKPFNDEELFSNVDALYKLCNKSKVRNIIIRNLFVWFVILLWIMLHESISVKTDYVSIPFYCVYKPPNVDSRILNQFSVFIYQMFYYRRADDLYSCPIYVQRIVPDVSIIVKNKRKILEELDMIGINEKYVFNDFDGAARYIKEKNIKSFMV